MQPTMRNGFGLGDMLGVQNVGGRYINVGGGLRAPRPGLGDDAAVMMISGLGVTPEAQTALTASSAQPTMAAGIDIATALRTPVKVLGVTLPLWAWLLMAAGALSAGWFFFLRKK